MKTLVLSIFVLVLTSCGGNASPDFPRGEQTIDGILFPAELSLTRRGTHVIHIDGVETYFVESPSITLRAYENKLATYRGEIIENTDPEAYPLFLVSSVADVQETSQDWFLQSLDITLETPIAWTLYERSSTVHFFTQKDAEYSTVTISQEDGDSLPEGESIIIDGLPGIREQAQDDGSQRIHIARDSSILSLIFTPRESDNLSLLTTQWISLLDSLVIHKEFGLHEGEISSSGSSIRSQPCGGVAGILCPEGLYCEVLDKSDGVGRCRKL